MKQKIYGLLKGRNHFTINGSVVTQKVFSNFIITAKNSGAFTHLQRSYM